MNFKHFSFSDLSFCKLHERVGKSNYKLFTIFRFLADWKSAIYIQMALSCWMTRRSRSRDRSAGKTQMLSNREPILKTKLVSCKRAINQILNAAIKEPAMKIKRDLKKMLILMPLISPATFFARVFST